MFEQSKFQSSHINCILIIISDKRIDLVNVYAISYKHWFPHLYTYSVWLVSLFILKSGVIYIQNSRVLLLDGAWGSIAITFPWDVNLKANWNLDKSGTVQPSTYILYNMSTLVQGQGRGLTSRDNNGIRQKIVCN